MTPIPSTLTWPEAMNGIEAKSRVRAIVGTASTSDSAEGRTRPRSTSSAAIASTIRTTSVVVARCGIRIVNEQTAISAARPTGPSRPTGASRRSTTRIARPISSDRPQISAAEA